MEINVLIVDDKPFFARLMEKTIKGFPSQFSNVSFIPDIIKGNNPIDFATKYINNNQHDINIMLIDYFLEKTKYGTELFTIIDTSKYLVYKLLYSVFDKAIIDTKDDVDRVFDSACPSKKPDDVIKEIRKFENNILKLKLYGNHNLTLDISEIENFDLKQKELEEKLSFRFENVVYVYPIGENKNEYTVGYRSKDTIKEITTFNKIFSARSLNQTFSIFYTVVVSNFLNKIPEVSVTMNLRWVSHIDLLKKEIHIIHPRFSRFIAVYSKFLSYNILNDDGEFVSHVINNELIIKLNHNIDRYFYR